ncbi:zinc finger protein 468-like isoform X2 [Schistocerca nitens]|nr:zinc finger protein 468-like isoform X2 [Schistocerca nitens]XP_049796539.1 zinc finger protein 468-like isoform X2 [Schistocerca nitens]
MDQEPAMWIKKEGADEVKTELYFMNQQTQALLDALGQLVQGNVQCKTMRQPPLHRYRSRNTQLHHLFVSLMRQWKAGRSGHANLDFISPPTEFKAQVYPLNMNIKEELEEDVNKESIEDPLGISWSTDFIKEDPELNLEMSVTENIVETSTRYASDSTRLTQCTSGSCGIPCEETCHHRLVQDVLVIDMKSTHKFGTNTEDMTIHTGNKSHKCEICSKSFSSRSTLNRHTIIHTGKKSHKCEICGKSFAFPSHLKEHVFLHTGKKPHKCELCGQSFASRSTLNRHTFIHTGRKSHKCEICGKSFARTSNLKAHKLIHTGKKRHKCEICGKSCAFSCSLKKHMFLHTGKKPHKCGICGKSFAYSCDLQNHVFLHTGKKPHKCEICGKSFAFSNGLKKHVLLHTGKKPHKCEIRGKSSARAGNLKTHVHSHQEDTSQK